MSILTPIFNLFKLQKSDPYAISQFNENMDIIDTEMAKPPLTVNGISPDPETRDLEVTTVPLADNLTSEEAQINTGTYVIRTSGGEASIADGAAMLSDIKGGMVKTGYVAESIQMSVTQADPSTEDPISATLDHDTFVEAASTSGTYTFLYSNAWSVDPDSYGITVTGTPVAGDQIIVVYVKENRGTITTATPTSFVSTGWNLYNHAAGYARVVDYSSEYGFMIEGTYTALKFSETLSGEQTTITPVDGYFTVPSDGYVFVTGGNDTDTIIWMTWSDWTEEANGGVFEAYTQTSVDLSGVMVNFPDGLMNIGNVYDEINLNIGRAYSRIEKMEYTEANLEAVIASGVPYDTDTGYIYAVRVSPVTYTISLDGEYTVSDHGIEMFLGTSVDLTASSVYGNDLKGKLRRDVVTISQQTLTSAQKTQVRTNIGAFSQADGNVLNSNKANFFTLGVFSATTFADFLKAVCASYYNNNSAVDNKADNFVATWSGHDYHTGMIRKIGANVFCSTFIGVDIASCQYNATNQSISVNDINSNIANKLDKTGFQVSSANATSFTFDAPRPIPGAYSFGLMFGATGSGSTDCYLYIVFVNTKANNNAVSILPIKAHSSYIFTGSYNESTSKLTINSSGTCYGGMCFLWRGQA